MNGTIAVEKKNENEGTAKISVNINELGKVELKVKYAVKLNEKIDEINPSNSVKLDAITQEDQKKILISLQNSELYKLITKFGGSTSELPNIGGDPIDNNNTEPDIDNPDTNVIDGNIVDSNTVINNNTTISFVLIFKFFFNNNMIVQNIFIIANNVLKKLTLVI